MLRLKKQVKEAKQVGTLYHVCTPKALVYNLKNNSITPGKQANTIHGKDTVSFTRDKGLIVDTVYGNPILFQMVIDGDKLSENTKIRPYADPYLITSGDPEFSEKEEVALSSVKNLKSLLKGINIFIIESVIYKLITAIDQSYYTFLLEGLELIKKLNIPTKISVVTSYTKLDPVQSIVPKDLDSFIKLIKKAENYDSLAVFSAIKNILNSVFDTVTIGKANKIKVELDDVPIKSISDIITTLTEIIQEQLNSTDIIVGEEKFDNKPIRRHGSIKLSTILKNKTYTVSAITVSPILEWINGTSPWISIDVLLSSNAPKTFYIYFI